MTHGYRVRLMLAFAAVGVVLAALGLYRGASSRNKALVQPAVNPGSLGFVGDSECATCHEDVAHQYAHSGMARAWARVSKGLQLPMDAVVHAPGALRYRAVWVEDKLFQVELRADDSGVEHEVQRRRADYVLGSGNKGYSFVSAEHGYLTALPMAWYSQKHQWALSPGYEKNNLRFDRKITPSCISCHNAMVEHRPGSANAYVEPLPMGLGCQRCHGPGAAHVAWRRGDQSGVDPIVNPAKLAYDRQQDVCLQCHLSGDVALMQPGCDAWSFRPGKALAEVRSDFLLTQDHGKFQAVGHGPRSMASKCFQRSDRRMTCIFCHDPHDSVERTPRSHFIQRCLACHASDDCSRPRTPPANDNGDCIACHMPKNDTSDIPHTNATEHWIHRPGATLGIPAETSQLEAELVPFWAGTAAGQTGAAYIEHFSDQANSAALVAKGVELLESAIRSNPTAEWRQALARGYSSIGRAAQAVELARGLSRDYPDSIEARHLHASMLGQTGNVLQAQQEFVRMLERWPFYADADDALARRLVSTGATQQLLDLNERVFSLHPDTAGRLEAIALAQHRAGMPFAQVAATLERAVRADGLAESTYLTWAMLAGVANRIDEIERVLTNGVSVLPESVPIRLAMATYLQSVGRGAEATPHLQVVVKIDPTNRQAHSMLLRSTGQ